MITTYYVRLDDASPFMDSDKWTRVTQILDSYGIAPLIGIIPENADPKTKPCKEDLNFWAKARDWQKRGYSLALHGFNHCYSTDSGGLNPLFPRSEFAGNPYDIQYQKISEGYAKLKSERIEPKLFFAPSHTFDRTTLQVLKASTPIRTVCDTMAFAPYRNGDFTFIPAQLGSFRKIPLPGRWIFCFHPNTMDDKSISAFKDFISRYHDRFRSFSELPITVKKRASVFDKLLRRAYFIVRRLNRRKYKNL